MSEPSSSSGPFDEGSLNMGNEEAPASSSSSSAETSPEGSPEQEVIEVGHGEQSPPDARVNLPDPFMDSLQVDVDVEVEDRIQQQVLAPNSQRVSSDSSELPELQPPVQRNSRSRSSSSSSDPGPTRSSSSSSSEDSGPVMSSSSSDPGPTRSSSSSSSDQGPTRSSYSSDSEYDQEKERRGSQKPSTSQAEPPKKRGRPRKQEKEARPEPAPIFSYRVLTLQAKNEQAAASANVTPAPVKPKKAKATPRQASTPAKATERRLIDDERAYEHYYYQSASDEEDQGQESEEEWNKGKGIGFKYTPHKKKKTDKKKSVKKTCNSEAPMSSSRPSRTSAIAATYGRKRVHHPTPSPSSSMTSPAPKTPKIDKTALKNVMDRQTFTENSRRWFTHACVRSKTKELGKQGEVPEAIYDMIMERTKEIEEPNCYSKVVPLNIQMPSPDNYRNLDTLVKQEIYSSHIPAPETTPDSDTVELQMINFTGSNHLDIHKTKGPGIVNRVKKSGRRGVAELLKREKKLVLLQAKYGCKKFIKEEAAKIVDDPRDLEKLRKGTLPVFSLKVNTKEDFEAARKTIEDSSICLIEGTIEACGFDPSKFAPDVLKELQTDYDMTGPRQMPQPMGMNHPRCTTGGKSTKFPSNGWQCPDTQHNIWFPEFVKYFKDVQRTAEKGVNRIIRNPEQIEEILESLAVKFTDLTMPLPEDDKGLKGALTIAFGSNIDIEKRTYESGENSGKLCFAEQLENVEKFPAFIHPDYNYSLLDYCGTYMSGINTPQVYMKVPGVRTAAHLENGCLASINLNLGPGSSIWASIPLEYTGKFQELVKRKIGLTDEDHERYFDYGFWPNEEELLKEGIPLQKFEQKAGDMAFVGIGTYHWVQANEFTTQVSWNIALPNHRQLSWLAISHDHYLAHRHPPLIPLDTLVWGLAEVDANRRHEAPDMDAKMRRVAKTMLIRSLANCQAQLMFLERKKLKPKMLDNKSPRPERCLNCSNWTFNIFLREKKEIRVVENRIEGPGIYCLGCANRLQKFSDPNFEVIQRHKISKLVEWYDSFSLIPPPSTGQIKTKIVNLEEMEREAEPIEQEQDDEIVENAQEDPEEEKDSETDTESSDSSKSSDSDSDD